MQQIILCSAFKVKQNPDMLPNTADEYIEMVKKSVCRKPAVFSTQIGDLCEFHFLEICKDNYAAYLDRLKSNLAKAGLVE